MLAFQNFLIKHKVVQDFPVPNGKGFIAYQKTEKKLSSINFIFFSMESVRNSLSTYNFKFTNVEMKPGNQYNDLSSRNHEVDWEKFFDTMFDLKQGIKKAESYNIAETVDEADYLIWKSFVIINDSWFSVHFSKVPNSFLESLNEAKSFEYRHKNKKEFIAYMKDNFPDMHNSWAKYFQRDYCDYFCSWFHHYFYS
jgi:hypothetical protein